MGRKSGKRSSLISEDVEARADEATKKLDIALGILCKRCEMKINDLDDTDHWRGERLCKKCGVFVAEEERARVLKEWASLPTEERLRKIEEWMYDHELVPYEPAEADMRFR